MATLYRQTLGLDTLTRNASSACPDTRTSHCSQNLYSETPGKLLLKGREVIKLSEGDMILNGQFQACEDFSVIVRNVRIKVIKHQDVLTHYGSLGIAEQ